jgi:hypothetical protein
MTKELAELVAANDQLKASLLTWISSLTPEEKATLFNAAELSKPTNDMTIMEHYFATLIILGNREIMEAILRSKLQ